MPVPRLKRLRRRLRALALEALIGVLRFLPLGLALPLGRGLGRLAFHLARGERRRAEENLRIAFPDGDDAFVEDTVRRMFIGFGEHLMELVCVRKVERRAGWVRFEAEDRAILDTALGRGRGVVVLTGHIGNWELGARTLAQAGYEVVAVARESHDPGLQRIIEGFRAEGGVHTVLRGQPGAAMKMLRQFRRGGSLFMLVDQDTDVASVFAPFFGRPAKTARAPADLCRRTGADLVAYFMHREGPGRGHQLVFRRIEVADTGDADADCLATTTAVNAAYEAWIRAHPADWAWFHRRWRSKPPSR